MLAQLYSKRISNEHRLWTSITQMLRETCQLMIEQLMLIEVGEAHLRLPRLLKSPLRATRASI